MKKIVVSGAQTSGMLHLGNYLGSIKNWIELQEDHDCFFFLADLHAITTPQPKEQLLQSSLESTAMYLAAGVNPSISTFFVQSSVPAHSELAWILNCITPLGWLKRMTQFKDKSAKNQENINLGLLAYPVLMAADVLLYQANLVPVGDDQKQHLELARDIGALMNRKAGREVLNLPEALIKGVTRVMSLRDGQKKMSKSDSSDGSRINLTDSIDQINYKLQRAKTDNFSHISFEPATRPAIANLLQIYAACAEQDIVEIVNQYEGKGFAEFKKGLTEIVIELLSPLQSKYYDLMQNQDYLFSVLKEGNAKANVAANKTLNLIKSEFGLLLPK